MGLDPELLKQLIISFTSELDEHTQAITNGLLSLEKSALSEDEKNKTIETIFRAAHNIKGTSRSLGINNVGEIAHRIESIFTMLQNDQINITPTIIDICLEAVDKMRSALQAFIKKENLPFDLPHFLSQLETVLKNRNPETIKEKIPKKIIKKGPIKHESPESDSLRVSIAKIDKISSLLEDIQVNKIAIADHYRSLEHIVNKMNEFASVWKQISYGIKTHPLFQTGNDYFFEISKATKEMQKNMRSHVNDLSLISHSLQDEVRTLQMLPVGNLLCRLPRYIRDLSQSLNKKVELHIKGEEIKIDKSVLERLKDPIIHVLRNAIDHGIEEMETRKLKGKSEIGNIFIDIKEENAKLIISISDDGAGIDSTTIASIATNKKIISKEEVAKLKESEILELIFNSGFSTKDIITDVSGRGVGLNVVKSNIDDLKGQINLLTSKDKGTTFIFTVPLHIASERGLLVKCSNEHFVIPTTSVARVLLAEMGKLVEIQGGQAINLDNQTIPVRMLADILCLEKRTLLSENQIPIIIVKKGNKAIAFIIDEIIGEREIVLKPLNPPLSKVPCVAGGTLLESNKIIIVLDPNDLINKSLQGDKESRVTFQAETPTLDTRSHILVVDDSITTRTLEKNVLESKNYQVTVAVNGKEAWDILQKQKFSLMITDVTMPIMDGFTLTDHVKKNEKLADMPVIIVTSLGSEAEKKRGIEVGADAYIVKSEFESGVLLDIVSRFI